MPAPRRKAAAKPAPVVDDTVKNQESLGSAPVVDRSPQVEEDPMAVAEDSRKNAVRQTEAVLGGPDFDKTSSGVTRLRFVETGLTAGGKVWKRGEVYDIADSVRSEHADLNGHVWYELSADEQKSRYGKVFFEKE